MLPKVSPSSLTSVKEPIGHPDWIYELKHEGFRGILYVDRERAWLVSRKGKKVRQFDPLLKRVLRCLKGQRTILDGEIVVLDEKGRSNFYDLMAALASLAHYAFDLVWLNRQDLRSKPLLLRRVVSQFESRDWEVDPWLLVTSTMRRAGSVQPHLSVTSAHAIL